MNDYTYYKARGIDYTGQLRKIKKSSNYLQPIFEALTNSLEAIKSNKNEDPQIIIKLDFGGNLFSDNKDIKNLDQIKIYDNGIGFTDKEFDRLKNIHDDSKGRLNKGSGRLQLIHFFEEAIYESVYSTDESNTIFSKRLFKLSKSEDFLSHYAILSYKEPISEKNEKTSFTKLTLKSLLSEMDKKAYSELTPSILKEEILSRYLEYFVANKESLPRITIETSLDNENEIITSDDIATFDKEEEIKINYKSLNGNHYEKIDKIEKFTIRSFVISDDKLSENSLKLTSKKEIVSDENIVKNISLDILKPKDSINSQRYLFLISGDYIDAKDTDNRGELELYTEEEAKKTLNKDQELILLDDIRNDVNTKILSMYEEIKAKQEDHTENLEKLRKMFLLNKETLNKLKNKISINDTDESILKKVYKADVEIIAEKDAKIKDKIDKLGALDLSSSSHQIQLNNKIKELVEIIPLQNRTALTHAVARRKLVLDLFDKVLNRSLDMQNSGSRNIDEELLHNLIFPQNSQNTDKSNLWVINEDYIHFKGTSESRLDGIEINGENIFKENSSLSPDELSIKMSLGKNRGILRTDVLLFPEEGKCIILEFKNPNVEISKHLSQINNYATLILNFTKDEYKFHTFYGYLIGEKMNDFDIRSNESTFKEIPNESGFNYWRKPVSPVVGYFNNEDAEIFLEIIKFSTILKRAKLRNKHYIDKLFGNSDNETL